VHEGIKRAPVESLVISAGKLRQMPNEFKQQVDEAMREAELVEVREAIESGRDPSRIT
jgi:hypothetical protein